MPADEPDLPILALDAAETRNRESANDALPALAIAREATGVLAEVLHGVVIPAASEPVPNSYYVRSASFLLGVIALRTARACILVVEAGYWPEAHALKRRLSEVHARGQAIAEDPSGQHARDWLEGSGPSTPHRLVGKWGSADLWKIYGWGAHADAESVHQWLSEPVGDIRHGVRLDPSHDDQLSNGELVECAMECRDLAMACVLCRAPNKREWSVNRQAISLALDGEIERMCERYYVPLDPD